MSLKNEDKKTLDELKKNNPNEEDPNKLMGNIDDSPNRNALNESDTKVQNPNRNLAKGGNNTPANK